MYLLARYIFIRQQVSLKKKKKKILDSQFQTEKVAKDLKSSTRNGKLTFKEDLGNIQSSFQVDMMSLGRHGKTR